MVKVAFIPPLGWESYFQCSSRIQMGLAVESCMAHGSYNVALKAHSRAGDYVIVDNGEAEGQRARGGTLMHFAARVEASEVVLPDIMGERHITAQKVSEFFRAAGNYVPGMNYMAVVQGKSLRDFQLAVHYFAEFKVHSLEHGELQPITTLGIPRVMIKTTGLIYSRIDFARWVEEKYPGRFQIHFLGAWGAWPQEIKYVRKYADFIRSIDTSLPFNYAIANRIMIATGNVESPPRHVDYLTGRLPKPMTHVGYSAVMENLLTYKTWAEGL